MRFSVGVSLTNRVVHGTFAEDLSLRRPTVLLVKELLGLLCPFLDTYRKFMYEHDQRYDEPLSARSLRGDSSQVA